MKKLLLLIGLLLIVGSASAWTIQSKDYTGTINFEANGVGTAYVEGYPPTMFSWNWVSGDHYEARYLWYKVDFTYFNGIITSPQFPGARLV
jgi:hypothetical protein